MAEIRTQNGKRMAEILKKAGPAGATFKKKWEWDLGVYIPDDSEQEPDSVRVEMAAMKHVNGDLLMNPFMDIRLEKDADGQITQAHPLSYQADNLALGRMEINEKGEVFINRELVETEEGALDQALADWLDSIDSIGYLTKPDEILFHE